MLIAAFIDGFRLATRTWRNNPVVSTITLLSFALAAAAIGTALDTIVYLRGDAYREFPPDLGPRIGYVTITGTTGQGLDRPVFSPDLFKKLLDSPDVAGVFARLDRKRLLVDGVEQQAQLVVFGGTYPFCTPADRELLTSAETTGSAAVCSRLAGDMGRVPALIQPFPDRQLNVAGVIGSTARSSGYTIYYPVGLLPEGGTREIGLTASATDRLTPALDLACQLIQAAYPDTTVLIERESAASRLQGRLAGYRSLASALAGLSLATLLVAAVNLANLFALVLLRQSRSIIIRRCLGLAPAAAGLVAAVSSTGLAVLGSAAGYLAAAAARPWLGIDIQPVGWAAGVAVAAITATATAVLLPLVVRLTKSEPGVLLKTGL